MKRRLAVLLRVLIIALVILALFLFSSAVLWGNVSSAPTATTGVELLITVILCLSLSLWAAFVDKEAKRWEGVLVFVGLILGSLLFFVSYWRAFSDLNWMTLTQQTAATINNESIVIDCLVGITIILVLAAVAVFGLILRRALARAYFMNLGLLARSQRRRSDRECKKRLQKDTIEIE